MSANSRAKNIEKHQCNICKIIFDDIDTLNAHNRMEHGDLPDSGPYAKPSQDTAIDAVFKMRDNIVDIITEE